jgi:hypothetical protein
VSQVQLSELKIAVGPTGVKQLLYQLSGLLLTYLVESIEL